MVADADAARIVLRVTAGIPLVVMCV